MKKIIFVCKHNAFRSKVAEAVFKKKYRGSKYKAISRGVIVGPFIYPNTKKVVKECGYVISGKPRGLTHNEVRDADILIVVANDVPRALFENYEKSGKELIVWEIEDTTTEKSEQIKNIVGKIEKKVSEFVEGLE